MKTDLKTIFSKLPIPTSEQAETKKITYWLEKLFNQEKEQKEKQEKEKIIDQSAEERGLESALINRSKKLEFDRRRLENMVMNSNRILISVSSVFPFDLFPTTINVEATRLTIIHRQLFASQVHSVDIKNISNILLDTGILFATITIISSTFVENNIKIGRVWKKEAILVRRILEGLRMFIKEDIDTTTYTVEELLSKLKELSTTKIVM